MIRETNDKKDPDIQAKRRALGRENSRDRVQWQ